MDNRSKGSTVSGMSEGRPPASDIENLSRGKRTERARYPGGHTCDLVQSTEPIHGDERLLLSDILRCHLLEKLRFRDCRRDAVDSHPGRLQFSG